MKNKTCCFTGHRTLPENEIPAIRKKLNREISYLIEKGYRYFGTGGALGFDTVAAQEVLSLKKIYPQIKLILVLPCREQDKFWNEIDRKSYENLREQADKIVYTSQRYEPGCMQKRNRHLVDHSSICIAYLTASSGGTFYTVHYAKGWGLKIINLAEITD